MANIYDQLKIKSYKHWDIYLHENQCYLGRVFVQLREKNSCEDFIEIDGEVRDEFFKIGKNTKKSLINLFKPDKFNYAALSNVSPKLHVHIVPRYKGPREFCGHIFEDARWGKNFAPYDRTLALEQPVLFQIRDSLIENLN